MSMGIELAWCDGGTACVLETNGDRVQLRSSRSAPPGSPLQATTNLTEPARVCIKVHGCCRDDAGLFLMQGRWVNLTRKAREQILAHV